jgi:hypothetical protein
MAYMPDIKRTAIESLLLGCLDIEFPLSPSKAPPGELDPE